MILGGRRNLPEVAVKKKPFFINLYCINSSIQVIFERVQSASLLDGLVDEIDKDIPNNVSAVCWKENT